MIPETMQLWLLMALLITPVLVYMLMPLIRPRRADTDTDDRREVYDINVYKDQLEEVERDLERGVLAPEMAEAARTEIKRRLLTADAATGQPAGPSETRPPMLLVVVLAVAVPVGAVLMYLNLGSPTLPDQPLSARATPPPEVDPKEVERRKNMIAAMAKLADKLQKKPDDLRGWVLMGRSHVALEQYAEAIDAYGRAYKLSGKDADIGVDYAEAMAFADGAAVPPAAIAVFQEVLAKAPMSPKARYYLSLSKAQQGDGVGAMQGWVDLAAMSPPDAPWMGLVNQQLDLASKRFGIARSAFRATDGTMKLFQQSEQPPRPSRADVDAASQMTDQQRQQLIRTMVQRLADRLKENPDDKQGWLRLEKAYRVLGETAKADEAAAKAAALP